MKNYLIVILVILSAASIAFWGNTVSEIEIKSTFSMIIFFVVYFLVATKIFKFDPFELYVGFIILINVILFILNRYF